MLSSLSPHFQYGFNPFIQFIVRPITMLTLFTHVFFQVPTPNATFEQLSPNQVVLTERGLLMEIYSSKDQSNSDQCRCDEIGSNLGTPKTLYVPLVEFNSFNFKQMKGPSPLLQYDFGPLYAHHIKVRFTGMLRIRQTGTYVFKAKSDDCVTV